MEGKPIIPEFNPQNGFQYKWENGFSIEVRVTEGTVNIISNKAGLVSLGNHLLNLAQDDFPDGYHLHLDEYNSLEGGSQNLIIWKNK